MGKVYILAGVVAVIIVLCNNLLSDISLGSNFFLLLGDSKGDEMIVYCNSKSGGQCISGTPVLPTYAQHYD